MKIWDDMTAALAELDARSLRRRLRIVDSAAEPRVTVDGAELICLCSNNYLNLAAHPKVKAAAADAAARWGAGAGASRLVSGTTALHARLEEALAAFEGAEAAITTSTGWQANACAIAALAGKGDLILADKLDHASILDAARASGATFRTYGHNDAARLRTLLERLGDSHRRRVIITDGLFSMDGDVAPLAELVEIKRRFDAVLVVDEAHATGVLGPDGRGAAEAAGVKGDVDVVVGTLSKALGALGGFIAGPRVLIDTIVNTARPFIYTTALPPVVCAAALAALEIVADEPQRRRRCLTLADDLRRRLADAGHDTGASTTQIIPVIYGDAARADAAARICLDAGFLAPAIRPPTVAPGLARLRLSIMADHDPADLERLATILPRR